MKYVRKPGYRKRSTKIIKKFPRKSARSTSRNPSLVKTVKKIIHSQLENKVVSGYAVNQSIAYAGSVTDPTRLTLVPAIQQGTGSNNRIGNQVRVVKAFVRGFVNLKPYSSLTNLTQCPIYVKMWLCRRVDTNLTITGFPGTTDFSNFFQQGNSTLPFQSNMLDMLLFTNKDYWTVFKTKTIQLGTLTNPSASNSTLLAGNSQVSAPFYFDLTKHLGLLKFNDNNASYVPTNKELFLIFQAVQADGASTTLLDCAEYHYTVQYDYEDA